MASYETLLVDVKDGVAWLRLNRAEAFNAINMTMGKELYHAVGRCAVDEDVRVVVLAGAGGLFCGGGDVKFFAQDIDDAAKTGAMLKELVMHVHTAVAEIQRMPKPVIAAVNGMAVGAGFALTLSCDITLASDDARFICAYTGVRLSPDAGMTYHLSRLVGLKKAKEMAFLNEPISAGDALELGIVNRVIPSGNFEREVAGIAQRLAQGPTKTYARTKALFGRAENETVETQLEHERQGIAESAYGEEFKEGVMAFVEKRAPKFGSAG